MMFGILVHILNIVGQIECGYGPRTHTLANAMGFKVQITYAHGGQLGGIHFEIMCPFRQHGRLLGRAIEFDIIDTGITLTGLHTALALLLTIVGCTGTGIELGHLLRRWQWICNVVMSKHQRRHCPFLQSLVAQTTILKVHLTDGIVEEFSAIGHRSLQIGAPLGQQRDIAGETVQIGMIPIPITLAHSHTAGFTNIQLLNYIRIAMYIIVVVPEIQCGYRERTHTAANAIGFKV